MNNPNKAITAKPYGIIVSYTDTQKHYKIDYEPSVLSTQQVYGNQSVASKNIQKTNKHSLLNKALYGFKIYSHEELLEMSAAEKQSIKVLYTKTQRAINRLKNLKLQAKLNCILTQVFYKSALAKELAAYEAQEELHQKNDMSLKELGISMDTVVDYLIECRVFPPNYKSYDPA